MNRSYDLVVLGAGISGLASRLLPKQKLRYRMLAGGRQSSIVSRLHFAELLVSLPRLLTAQKTGKSVAEYYGRVMGRANYFNPQRLDPERCVGRINRLPALRVGHPALVGELDRLLGSHRLALTGNYFSGVSIEDCVSRSAAEYARLRRLG